MSEKIRSKRSLSKSFLSSLLSRASFSGSLLFTLGCLFFLYQTGRIPRIQPQGQVPVVAWPAFMLVAMIVISLGKAVQTFVICRRERRCPPEETTVSLLDKEMADTDGLGILGRFVEAEVKEAAIAKGEPSPTEVKVERDYKVVVGASLISLFYVALMHFSGFALANLVFMACYLVFTGERKLLRLVLIPTLSTVAFLYIFVKVIYVSLPLGKWVFGDITIALYRLLHIY